MLFQNKKIESLFSHLLCKFLHLVCNFAFTLQNHTPPTSATSEIV